MVPSGAFYVKVIPPSKRARIHTSECKHCNGGDGQANQDKGKGPTFWKGPFELFEQAHEFMEKLGTSYTDVGACQYCKPTPRS